MATEEFGIKCKKLANCHENMLNNLPKGMREWVPEHKLKQCVDAVEYIQTYISTGRPERRKDTQKETY